MYKAQDKYSWSGQQWCRGRQQHIHPFLKTMHKSYPPSTNWWIVIAAFRLNVWLLAMQKKKERERYSHLRLVIVGTVKRPWSAEVSLGRVRTPCNVRTDRRGNLSGHRELHPALCLQWACSEQLIYRTDTQCVCYHWQLTHTHIHNYFLRKKTHTHKPVAHCPVLIPALCVLYFCHLEDVFSKCRPVAGF